MTTSADLPPDLPADLSRIDARDLVARFGSPLFVFSETTLRTRVREFRRAFAAACPRVRFAWSYKTNYLRAICRILHEEGADAEVVSDMEARMAEELGVSPDRVVFNGPFKSRHMLRKIVAGGGLVNVDHSDELDDLESIAAELGRPLGIGLRLNFSQVQNGWSRFGLDFPSGEAGEAVERLARSPRLKLIALHEHDGMMLTDPQQLAALVQRLGIFAAVVAGAGLPPLAMIDIGGGIASSALPLDHGQVHFVPPPKWFADAVGEALRQSFPQDPLPTVILELGRTLIDDAACLLTSVVGRKRLGDGRRVYIVDAGVQTLPMATKQRLYAIPADGRRGPVDFPAGEPSTVFGPLCMPTDVLVQNARLPQLHRGDLLQLWPVGAYNLSQSSSFIQPQPAVVMLDEHHQPRLVCERESDHDLRRRELPE